MTDRAPRIWNIAFGSATPDEAADRYVKLLARHDVVKGERDTLIDAIMPNPKGVADAIAYLETERQDRGAPGVALCVRLDAPACLKCPLSWRDSVDGRDRVRCAAADHRVANFADNALGRPAPAWCPLRTGPVTVEGGP